MRCVTDSLAALAWIFPGEDTGATDAVLAEVAHQSAAALGLWPLEIANVLLLSERRRRIPRSERTQASRLPGELPINIDGQPAAQAFQTTLTLAAVRNPTAYEACYLELALRLGLPLATLDTPLTRLAEAVGVRLVFQS